MNSKPSGLASSGPSIDEAACRRFEQAWAAGQPEPIEQFLPAQTHPAYGRTLEELIHIEMELAWKAWCRPAEDSDLVRESPCLVESYLERFPALDQPAVVLRLVEQEFQLRQRCGDSPEPNEYCQRFPGVIVTGDELVATATQAGTLHSRPTAAPAKLPGIPGYEVLGELGRGGMGVVYQARHLKLKRLVALKMIRAGSHADEEERSRFLLEAEAVARLQHPNIVQIYEIGDFEGQPFFSLEFVDGGSLAGQLRGQPVGPPESAKLVEALARAMHAAHQRGIIHRDLKPANILLQNPETRNQKPELEGGSDSSFKFLLSGFSPKITDFGLAKQLDDDSGQTRTGAVMGTPAYMAPEQAAGQTKEVGPAADIYALGAILYELLTGQPPFRGENVVKTLEMVRTQDPVPPSRLQRKVPRDLETICLKCLAKEPSQRYASMLGLAQDLERFGAGEAILARREGLAAKLWRKARRHPKTVAAAVVVLAVLSVVGIVAARAIKEADDASARAGRITSLGQQVEAQPVDDNLDPKRFEQVEAMITELEGLGHAEAADARQRFHERYARMVADHIRQPTVPDVEAAQRAIEALARSAPAKAKLLQGELNQRRRGWESLLSLSGTTAPPFRNWEQVFDSSAVELQQQALVARTTVKEVKHTPVRTVLTSLPCQGDVELEATFDAGWDAAPELGLLLNASGGHAHNITALAFSPDGSTLVSASGADDLPGELRIWNVASGRLRVSQRARQPGRISLAFGKQLVMACSRGPEVHVLDPFTGQVRDRFLAHAGGVLALAWSADGRTLATGGGLQGKAGEIKLWDAAGWRELATLQGHNDAVASLAFSPDGRYLVSGSGHPQSKSHDRSVLVWDLGRRRVHFTATRANLEWPPPARFSADSRTLFVPGYVEQTTTAGQRPQHLGRWDVATGKGEAINMGMHACGMSALAVSPSGRYLAVASTWGDPHVRLLHLDAFVYDPLLEGGEGARHPRIISALEFSPDSRLLATGGWDHQVRLWDIAKERWRAVLTGNSYELILRAALPKDDAQGAHPKVVSLREARDSGSDAFLQIVRDGAVLQQAQLSLAQLDRAGPLRLRARREKNRLVVQVDPLAPLEFQDVLPLPRVDQGNFGLRWPEGIRLLSLQAKHQALAAVLSELEQADNLYAAERLLEALARYQKEAVRHGQTAVGQEARLKAAYCLLALRRTTEALELLERLAGEPGTRWPILATCEALLLRVAAHDTAEADTLFESLKARQRKKVELTSFIPDHIRHRLVAAYVGPVNVGAMMLLRPRSELIGNLDRARKVQDLFKMTVEDRLGVSSWLVRGYHAAGAHDRALQYAEEILSADVQWWYRSSGYISVVEQYCWLLHLRGDAERALTRLDDLYVKRSVDARESYSDLLLERARLYAALGRWDDVEKDLRDFVRDTPAGSTDYRAHAAVHLGIGLLEDRLGNRNAARAAWKQGTYQNWKRLRGLGTTNGAGLRELTHFNSLYGLILAALSGELSDRDALDFLERAFTTVGSESPLAVLKDRVPVSPALLREMWLTPRGKDCARRIAFRSDPYAEYLRLPLFLMGAELCRRGAFGGELFPEQDELIANMISSGLAAFGEGKLGTSHAFALATTWKGIGGALGWDSLATGLPADARGPAAYVMGHRFLRLGKPDAAITFFQTALKEAKPDSTLKRLTQAELDRLKP